MTKKIKILIGVVSCFVCFGIYWFYVRTTDTISSVTSNPIRVSTGSITTSIKSTGKINPIQTSTLYFSKQGTVKRIYKKVGDTVQAGELVAELDAKSATLDIASAEIALSNARNNLDKILGGSSETEKMKAKNTLVQAEASLEKQKKEHENLLIDRDYALENGLTNISSLEDKLALAKNELLYVENNIDDTVSTSSIEQDVAKGYTILEDAYNIIEPTLASINTILSIENKTNAQYWAIGENNQEVKGQVNSLYTKILAEDDEQEKKFKEVKNNSNSLTTILLGLTDMRETIGELNTLCNLSIASVRASRVGSEISDTLIEVKIQELTKLSTELSQQYESIEDIITALKNVDNTTLTNLGNSNSIASKRIALTNAENDLVKARQSLVQTKADYDTRVLTNSQNIDAQKNTIILNRASYQELLDGSSTDIVSAKNNIKSAEISLEKSKFGLKEYQLYATFDGVINDIPWIIGDTTTGSEGILLENKNTYEITLSLDQIDIVKIRPGMEAKIILDAFSTETYTGTVSSVSALATETSGVVSYQATIMLTLTRSDIYSKMSATVEVITASKDNIILIPTSAISTESGISYVDRVTDMSTISQMNTQRNIANTDHTISGAILSGEVRGFGPTASGNMRPPRTDISTTDRPTFNTERTAITLGISSNGKTEVLSGLSIGDIILQKMLSTGTTRIDSGIKTTQSPTRNSGGFSGPPPGGF